MRFAPDRQLVASFIVLIWLKLTIEPALQINFARPDLFIIFLVFYAFRVDSKLIIGLGFAFGLSKDVFSSDYFGLHTAAYTVGCLALHFLALKFDRDKRVNQLGALFVTAVTTVFIYSVLAALMPFESMGVRAHITRAIQIAVYTTGAGILLFPFMDKWLRLRLQGKQYQLF